MSDRTDRLVRMAGPATVATLPLLLLAIGPTSSFGWALGSILAGLSASIGLRLAGGGALRMLDGAPFAAALVIVTLLAIPSPAAELEAGVAGLGVLLWVGQDLSWPVPLARAARGLGLPALGLALSLGIAFGLPATQQSVGVAALLAVVSLAVLGWALGRPGRLAEPSPS